ncbi:MAG: cytochrome-c3 hydrogenase subunit gamma [Thermoplasmata archaeon]|nr:MAG: cytochrome-c3 hydrogenase subunit gamma [Thermoplasmata archaeon]
MNNMNNMNNVYSLYKCRVLRVYDLTEEEKLFLFRFEDAEIAETWTFTPGQFVQLTITGLGEVPISICSSPMRRGFFELCIKKAGRVTDKIHELQPGDVVGVRGPYGNGFPVQEFEEKDLLLIACGIGMAPLRSVFMYAIDNRWKFGNITVINSAKTGKRLLFRKELEAMRDVAEAENIRIIQTITRDPDWPGRVGRAQEHIKYANTSPENAYVCVCGPPQAYHDIFTKLIENGYNPRNIYVTLERRMKCGVGKCGHCIAGSSTFLKYICIDGPVFGYYDIISTPGLI